MQSFSLKESLSFFPSVCMCVDIVVRVDVSADSPNCKDNSKGLEASRADFGQNVRKGR